jgi:putative membrane protein
MISCASFSHQLQNLFLYKDVITTFEPKGEYLMTTISVLRWIVATIHLLGLGLGLGAIWSRSRALKNLSDPKNLTHAIYADTLWGIAALLWITTGLARAFSGLEKGSAYYLSSNAFWLKMILLGIVLLLEVWPMVTLIRWRIQLARGESINIQHASRFALISTVQAALVVAMIFVATAMARGLGV